MASLRRFLAFLVLCCLFVAPAFAHSGRTDSRGGHYDRSTGEYHFHHGHPAHQHPDGVCPYEGRKTVVPLKTSTPRPTATPTKHLPSRVSVKPTNTPTPKPTARPTARPTSTATPTSKPATVYSSRNYPPDEPPSESSPIETVAGIASGIGLVGLYFKVLARNYKRHRN